MVSVTLARCPSFPRDPPGFLRFPQYPTVFPQPAENLPMTSPSPSPAAQVLDEYCRTTGVSMRALSLKTGRGAKLVADIVHGRSRQPDRPTLEALAAVTGLAIETLHGGPLMAPTYPSKAARALAEYCERTGIAQSTLSLAVGGNSSLVNDIIRGASRFPQPATLKALAEATGIPLVNLMEDTAAPAPLGPTLQDALDAVAASTLPPATKDELRRDVGRLARHLMRPPSAVPAHVTSLRTLLTGTKAPRVGQSPERQSNFRRNIARAVELIGNHTLWQTARYLPEDWHRLLALLPDDHRRAPLSRFIRFGASQGRMPGDVDDALVADYWQALQTTGPLGLDDAAIRRRVAETIRAWNRAVEQHAVSGWPSVRLTPLPDARVVFRTPTSALGALLQEFDQRYKPWALGKCRRDGQPHAHGAARGRYADPDPAWRERPLAPRTIEEHRNMVVLAAKTLVDNGVLLAEVASIAAVVTPEAVTMTLAGIEERLAQAEGRDIAFEDSTYSLTVARVLRTIAITWGGATPGDIEILTRRVLQARPGAPGARGQRPTPKGMTERNKMRLRQFDDATIAAFLRLPSVLVAELEAERKGARGNVTPDMARRMQIAIALLLLRIAPVRRRNLASVTIDHIVRDVGGQGAQLQFAGHEMKTGKPFVRTISPTRLKVIDLYIRHYLPAVRAAGDDTNPHLFPSPVVPGTHLVPARLAARVCVVILERLNVVMHLHLVRHLIGRIMLRADPNSLAVVSAALGHGSLQTTRDFYAEIDPDMAGEAIDAMLAGVHADAGSPKRRA